MGTFSGGSKIVKIHLKKSAADHGSVQSSRTHSPGRVSPIAMAATVMLGSVAFPAYAATPLFTPGDLLVSSSTYTAPANLITVGQALPGGGTAVADASLPNVWNNETPDPSFGITSAITISDVTTSGSVVNSITLNDGNSGGMVTSFPSKSELGLNVSSDGSAVTFMGYVAPVNTLDVSNANTPNHVDATNPVASTYQRAIGQIDANGNVTVTAVNSYSGNNGRNAILVNNVNGTGQSNYYMVGNAGNGSGTEPTNIVNNTGVQIVAKGGGPETTVVGAQQGTPGSSNGFQYGYSVTQNGAAADKSGKDNNFRGETIFNNTLYVTKGSGSNGVNTVYQVGIAGSLPTGGTAGSTAISILPGLPTGIAKNQTTNGFYPFGLWFANSTTLYVGDEGDGTATDTHAGLQKWSLVSGTWQLDYTLQNGLNLGQKYSVSGLTDTALNPATAGLRNIAGRVNADGTVSIYAITSTASAATDAGADANRLVAISDALADTTSTQSALEQFSTLQTAVEGQVLRGVAVAPVPLPAAAWLFSSGLGALFGFVRRRRTSSV